MPNLAGAAQKSTPGAAPCPAPALRGIGGKRGRTRRRPRERPQAVVGCGMTAQFGITTVVGAGMRAGGANAMKPPGGGATCCGNAWTTCFCGCCCGCCCCARNGRANTRGLDPAWAWGGGALETGPICCCTWWLCIVSWGCTRAVVGRERIGPTCCCGCCCCCNCTRCGIERWDCADCVDIRASICCSYEAAMDEYGDIVDSVSFLLCKASSCTCSRATNSRKSSYPVSFGKPLPTTVGPPCLCVPV
mmetsp:Transcript_114640/g.331307  ORF Transcript_114640/g.331307 Transcript_114640/m.331307 type:complete len:247 (-) Transcript_114640:784-1524(-)